MLLALYNNGADVCCISEAALNQIPKHLQPPNLKASKKAGLLGSGPPMAIYVMYTLGKYNLKFRIPEEVKEQYLNFILKHHAAISRHKEDLGQTESLLHDIELRDSDPIHVQQFKIPDALRDELHC